MPAGIPWVNYCVFWPNDLGGFIVKRLRITNSQVRDYTARLLAGATTWEQVVFVFVLNEGREELSSLCESILFLGLVFTYMPHQITQRCQHPPAPDESGETWPVLKC